MMKKIRLMYHDVYRNDLNESGFITPGANHYKITERMFEGQLRVLSEMVEAGKLQKENVILSFDDGGVSFSEVIMPLLNRYGFMGHFYIATDYIDTPGFMASDQVRSLIDNGHFVGSHSSSHPDNISLLQENVREEEWTNSLRILSKICGCQMREVSIPNGYFDKKDICLLKKQGVEDVYTSLISEDRTIDGLHIVGRIAIDANMSIEDFKNIVTGGFYLKRMMMRQSVLELLKGLLGNNYVVIKKILRKRIH